MAKLVECKSCGKPVGYGALTCPNCGELHPSIRLGRAFAWLIGVCAAVAVAVVFLVAIAGREGADDGSTPAAATFSDSQLRSARDIFCDAQAHFDAETAKLTPCRLDQNSGDAIGDCKQRVALTGKYFGPLPDRIAVTLGVSREQAQQAMGWVQAKMGEGKLPHCAGK